MRRAPLEACFLLSSWRPVPSLLLSLVFACSSPPPLDNVPFFETRQDALTGSTPSIDEAVVAVVDSTAAVRCTGALLAPRTVLSSSSCLKSATGTLSIYVGPLVTKPVQTVQVRQVFEHDALALLQLSAPVTGIAPLSVSKTPLTADKLNQPVRRVGYGATMVGGSKLERRTGQQTIAEISQTQFVMGGAARVCDGDLGAPALLGEEIVSVAQEANCAGGTGSVDARADVAESALSQSWAGWEGGTVLADGGISIGADGGFNPLSLHGWPLGCAQTPGMASDGVLLSWVLLAVTLCVACRKASKR